MVKKLKLELIVAKIPEHITGDCPYDNGYRQALLDIKDANPKGLYTLKEFGEKLNE